MNSNLVLKIGGSIFEHNRMLDEFFKIFKKSQNPSVSYFFLFGGGNRCNRLRMEYKEEEYRKQREEYYHWEAINIMGENAENHVQQFGSEIAVSRGIFDRKTYTPAAYFLNPYKDFKKFDPLEHSWQVTSDSIADYYADRFQSPLCVLIKNKPFLEIEDVRIHKISSTKLIQKWKSQISDDILGKGVLDPVAPHLSKKYLIPILIIDGTNTNMVEGFFTGYPDNLKNLSEYGIEITP